MKVNYGEDLIKRAKEANLSPEETIDYLAEKYNQAMDVIGKLIENQLVIPGEYDKLITEIPTEEERTKWKNLWEAINFKDSIWSDLTKLLLINGK